MYLSRDCNTIVYNPRGPILALQNNIPSLWSQGNSNKIGKLIDSSLRYIINVLVSVQDSPGNAI